MLQLVADAPAYGMRGGWRATFTGAVLGYAMQAGFTGQGRPP
ncbi:MAG TPA: hypothetical protein VGI96_02585 [Streptosporangiaceae bacterium]